SEFDSWADVVRWALPLYRPSEPLSAELQAQIERWRSSFAQAEDRLIAALAFVQDEVRYTGIELGPYSHQPTPPSIVFGRRFGDCKDKALLLSTVLKRLGIEASPALVNSESRQTIADEQPSPHAFNHVIVVAELDGKRYWFDPTLSPQRGKLAVRYNPSYGFALLIRAGQSDIVSIPQK